MPLHLPASNCKAISAVVRSPGMISLATRRNLDDGTDFAGQYRSGSRRAAELYLVTLTSMVNLDNSPLLVPNHDDRLFRNRFSPSHRPSPYRNLLLHQQAFPGKMHVPGAKHLPHHSRERASCRLVVIIVFLLSDAGTLIVIIIAVVATASQSEGQTKQDCSRNTHLCFLPSVLPIVERQPAVHGCAGSPVVTSTSLRW